MILERIFGANWRTTLSGWGAAISSLIAFLAMANTDLGGFIPEQYKGKIALASAILAFVLKVINSIVAKDAAVSGIGTMDDPARKVDSTGTRSQLLPIMLAALILPFLTGCAWYTAHKTQVAYTGEHVVEKVAAIGAEWFKDWALSKIDREHKADYMDSAAQGIRFNLANIVTGEDLKREVVNWTADKTHWRDLGEQVAGAYDEAQGTSAQKAEAVAKGLNEAAANARNP